MSDQFDPQISLWIARLKDGDQEAAQLLWERYFQRLVWLARNRLRTLPRPPGDRDEEDVALSTFHSLWKGVERNRFPRLNDRTDLWRLLVFITSQKVCDCYRHESAQVNGGKHHRSSHVELDELVAHEPSPEFAAVVTEQCQILLDALGDDELCRIAIWKMDGFTNEEIAERLDCSLKTVSNRLRLIRKIWERHGFGESSGEPTGAPVGGPSASPAALPSPLVR